MGNLISCCCPETEDSTAGGGGDDAYGVGSGSDVAPLLRDGAGENGGDLSNSFGDSGDHFGSPYNDSFPGHAGSSANAVGLGIGRSPAGALAHNAPANRVQRRLDEILQEAGKQIIDCSADGTGGMARGERAADAHERSANYGRRLTAVAAELASKHVSNPHGAELGGGLSEVGGGHAAEKMSRQTADRIHANGDELLVTEVGAHSTKVSAECTVLAHKNLTMPFGRAAASENAAGDGTHLANA